MTEALVHRGPDSGGVTALGRCVLGHRRLRVVDLETGEQPATNESGDVVAVFNGELYDFHEVRRDLAKRGPRRCRAPATRQSSPTCTRSTASTFRPRSAGCSRSRSGTATRERLVLARDRVGKKPLHYVSLPDGGLAFASELKALLLLPGLRRELDPRALDAYLALQYVPGARPASAESGASPRATSSSGRTARSETHRFWELQPEPRELAEEEWLELVRATVTARCAAGSSATSRSARSSRAGSTPRSSSA